MGGRWAVWIIAGLVAACSCGARVASCGPQSSSKSRITIDLLTTGDGQKSFDVLGLTRDELVRLERARFTQSQWSELFAIHVRTDKTTRGGPPLLGIYSVVAGGVRFIPRFRLQPGLRYLAVFDPSRLPGPKSSRPEGGDLLVEREFSLPPAPTHATTTVEHVYPSRSVLPENLLKFYLHFSAPMQRGGAYENIRLLDGSGRQVEFPFLELDEELWDLEGRRFTLFFDPGRIKRGNRPREEVGPSLEQGKNYTLVIERRWLDAGRNPLKESYRKQFSVGPPDETQPNPDNFSISAPSAGSQEPLILDFPEALDHAMLQRVIKVTDALGKRVAGRISIEAEETRWRFIPTSVWKEGRYQLVMDTTLEDVAGNSIGRPFEVDLFHPIERRTLPETVALPFTVSPVGR